MSRKTANDIAWEKLLSEHSILEQIESQGFVDIESDLIRQYREPRLMCKIDFLETVPAVFRHHGLSVLAIVNKKYRIARTNPFLKIDSMQLAKIPTGYYCLLTYLETFTS